MTTMSMTPEVPSAQARAGKYLTFALGQELYGIPVLKIREIIRMADITPVPRMPDYIRGVINLRGKIIPVVDLRLKFGLPGAEATEQTCIVVVQVRVTDATIPMGLIVDAVEEVLNIAGSEIEDAPDFGTEVDTQFILGIGKTKGGVKTLLDIDCILAAEPALRRMGSGAEG